LQDRLAISKLRSVRKLDQFLSGKLSSNPIKNRDMFQKRVSMEWASWAENS